MRNGINKKMRALLELEKAMDIINTEQISLSLDTEYQRCYRRIDWISPNQGKAINIQDVTAEIMVDTHGDALRLMSLMKQLDATIHEGAKSYGGILRTAYLCDGSVSITIMIEPAKLNDLMVKLAVIPDVERVEDDVYAGDSSQHTSRKFRDLPYPVNSRINRRIRITLREKYPAG